jgi:cytochrome c551/c552/predicted nuclease with TOPRIM domain
MAMGPDLLESEEKRSFGAVFVLTVALLLACTVWAIWQDTFSRHLWKKHKADFYRTAIVKYEEDAAAEHDRLAGIEEYMALKTGLEEFRASLESGDERDQLDLLAAELADSKLDEFAADLNTRIVKGEIEEAWYHLEHARHAGESGSEEKQHLDELQARKVVIEAAYAEAQAEVAEIQGRIDAIHATETELVEKLRPWHAELEVLAVKLDSVSFEFFGGRVPNVPMIEQVVLSAFERNNFDQWVDRVERCQNCHVAIDRAGFEEEENPLKTHPKRKYYLGNHEVRKFGCTPCHGGQGASINSVYLAHGEDHYWEDPLLSTEDMVQSKCSSCHVSTEGFEGLEAVARGEQLFRDMGCHGCHLVDRYEDMYKTGPSLLRLSAKVSPEWLVDWIEEPKTFRPRTRMPHFFASRDDAEAAAAYLLSTSLSAGKAWLAEHPKPDGVNPESEAAVAKGKALTESLGCLGCHAFVEGEFVSEIAIGMDTAPNLARISEKTDTRWLYHWIQNPRGFSDTARMPRLRLSEDEAAAITSYLGSLSVEQAPAPDAGLRSRLADPEMIEKGAGVIRKFGCPGCHWIDGFENESRVSVELNGIADKHVEELFFGDRLDVAPTWDDWIFNKLLTPRTYATDRIIQLMPEFGFDEDDAHALMVFLASRSSHVVNETYKADQSGMSVQLFEGRALVAHYNCAGCHSFDGKEGAILSQYQGVDAENAPPILDGEGLKLQPEWFVDFLKKPMRLRPWLDVRMPTFGFTDAEASAIVRYFAALDGYELGPVVLESREEAHTALGHVATRPEEVVDCAACHVEGAAAPAATSYSVSQKPLGRAEINAWVSEHLGIELDNDDADENALRDYLGASAN